MSNWYATDLARRHQAGEHRLPHPDCQQCNPGHVTAIDVARVQEGLRAAASVLNLDGFCELMKIDPQADRVYAMDKYSSFEAAARVLCNFNPATLAAILAGAQEKLS